MKYYNLYIANTNDLFTYCDENSQYKIGDFVLVNFRNQEKIAVIVAQCKELEFEFKVLPIKGIVEDSISYTKEYIELLIWVKNYYMTGFSHIFNLGNSKKTKMIYKDIYRFNREYIPISENEKLLEKYFKKKDTGTASSIEKKYSKELLNEFLNSKILFYEKIVVKKEKKDSKIDYGDKNINEKSKELSSEQLIVKNAIEKDKSKYFLIKGVTGSGKTEVYIALIKAALKKGKGSIFLVPEIALTPQMVKRFREEFKEIVAIMHSKMTDSERRIEWEDIGRGVKKVVLGVRSAIFAPIKNLEYIIIDEEHETTYKQDTNPRYHAKYVAFKRAELESCKVVLGSATPSIESYYFAKKNIFKLLYMNNRYNGAILPNIEIVDMKNQENEFFSRELLKNIQEKLIKKEQVLILLNRKGYSTYIQCKSCGHVEECPHCSIKYSYYQNEKKLKCNYCGIEKNYTRKCSNCSSEDLIHSGKGVEKIYEELKKIFSVEIIRVDSEASKEKNFHTRMYEDFLEGKYEIMVGTQMITKGLHFPNVTLVGVISADMSLSFPDFRSLERTFQLLTQVSGRAGRGTKEGKVIIQTFQSENNIFKNIVEGDYEKFYEKEIEERELLFYPPFSKIINIGISSNYENELEQFSKNVYNNIKSDKVEIYGPMKSLVYKVKDRYRYNIFVKGYKENISNYKKILKENLKEYEKEKKYRITIDIDPINLI
ncbi:MAG: replication restart helicase PriA [Fusobacteriaceae bacterium]